MPSPGGNVAESSRRMREESLQPLPEVVTPICRGPSEYVESMVKVDKLDASATLTGIRSFLQRVDIRVPKL